MPSQLKIFTMLLAASVFSTIVHAQGAAVEVAADAVPWKTFASAAGVEVAAMYGVPSEAGLYTTRVRMQPGVRLLIHTHPDTRMVTVLSGSLYAGRGERYDTANETKVSSGGFFIVPAGSPHYVRAGEAGTVYQESGFGPTATKLVASATTSEAEKK